MKLKCSVISRDLEVIRFFQSFDNSNCVFNFYPFDLDSAYNTIIQFPPSILIVDFDHPVFKKSGLKPFEEIISYLSNSPILIGISSTKNYAYEALKAGFNDYLITPLKELEIRKSLLKFQNKIQVERKDCEMICLKSYSDYRFLMINEILFLKADNNTTDIFLKKEKEVTAFKSLGYFERKLPKCFFRIHNSYIINATAVRRINYNKSLLFFEDGMHSFSVPFSRTYKKNVDDLKDILGKSDISLSS